MAYIVVSDVHLGSKFCNHAKFCGFLDWLKGLETKEEIINCKGNDVKIQSPEKVILLGDILELWDPEDGDRDNVIKAGIKPFTVLSDLNCDKIYVVGNHDEALSELEKEVNDETLPNKTKFIIKNRHYPENQDGLKIGNHNYFFLHGQQFDKEQAILAWVSRLIGESWDPLGWFQSLFNITSTKKHWKTYFLVFAAMFLGGGYLLLSGISGNFSGSVSNIIQNSGLAGLKTIILWLLGAGVLSGLIYILWNKLYRMFFLISVIILGGWYFQEKSSLWILIWGALTGFFALSSIPGVVANTQRKFYNMLKSRDKTAQEIIEGDGYYKKEKDTIKADRVVFGHTHFASSFKTPEKLFINSGCWYGNEKPIGNNWRYTNTFVYIDESGAYLMRWTDSDKIECIEAF